MRCFAIRKRVYRMIFFLTMGDVNRFSHFDSIYIIRVIIINLIKFNKYSRWYFERNVTENVKPSPGYVLWLVFTRINTRSHIIFTLVNPSFAHCMYIHLSNLLTVNN